MTQNKALVDKLLTNVSNQYVPQDYIAERILPTFTVMEDSGKIGAYGNDHIRAGSYLHSGDGEYAKVKVDNRNLKTYSLEKHALSTIISEEDFRNVPAPYDARLDAVNHVTTLLWTEKEVSLKTVITNAALYSASNKVTLSGTAQYSDRTNSDPLGDSITARKAIRAKVGTNPNIVIMSENVFDELRVNPSILGSLGYKDSRPGGLEMGELARSLQVDEVIIGKAMYNNAVEGQADNLVPIWGNEVIYAVSPKSAAKRQISLGYRVQGQAPRRVSKVSVQDPVGAEKVLIDDKYEQLIVNIDAAYLIIDAIA
jgi:hypothetical protein